MSVVVTQVPKTGWFLHDTGGILPALVPFTVPYTPGAFKALQVFAHAPNNPPHEWVRRPIVPGFPGILDCEFTPSVDYFGDGSLTFRAGFNNGSMIMLIYETREDLTRLPE